MEQNDTIRDEIEREDKARKERRLIGEKQAGVSEGFIDRCDELLDYFQMDHFDAGSELLLSEFFHELTHLQEECDFDCTAKANGCGQSHEAKYKNLDCFDSEWWEEIHDEALYTPHKIAFAIGFVLGQGIEVTDPDMQKKIETIKRVIKKKQLLLYLPRERKAA